MPKITVEDDVMEFINDHGQDFRVCTSCYGPVIVPLYMKPPKPSDITIPVGEHTLYVSRVQAMYVSRITMNMVFENYDMDSCPAIRGL